MSQPELEARFANADLPSHQAGGVTHYEIELHVRDAPADTYAVTYRLDETYYEPNREARNAKADFAEVITSYGDYQVTADVRTRSGTIRLAGRLSRLLERGHKQELVGAAADRVKHAIAEIRRN
jgi:hypothetical protein